MKKFRSELAGLLLAVAAAVGLSVASAGGVAADPVGSPATEQLGAAVDARVLGWSTTLRFLESKTVPEIRCPTETPYLIKNDYSPGRVVARGVEVAVEGNAGVTLMTEVTDKEGMVVGSGGVSVLNSVTGYMGRIDQYDKVTIYLHCTSDRSKGYLHF